LRVRFARDSLVFSAGEEFEFPRRSAPGPRRRSPTIPWSAACACRRPEATPSCGRRPRSPCRARRPAAGNRSLVARVPEQDAFTICTSRSASGRLPTRCLANQGPHSAQRSTRGASSASGSAGCRGVASRGRDTAAGRRWRRERGVPARRAAPAAARPDAVSGNRSPNCRTGNGCPGSDSSGREAPIGNGLSRLRKVASRDLGRTVAGRLAGVSGWSPKSAAPHVVEVEVSGRRGADPGISVVEPNAAGMVTPIGLHSGVDVAAAVDATSSRAASGTG